VHILSASQSINHGGTVNSNYTFTAANVFEEAEWKPYTPPASVDKFAIVIYEDGKKDRITLLSPYLQKVFRSVVKYFPEVVIDNKTLSFTEPYAPLYFYLDDMLRYVQNDRDPEANPEDMDVLMLFYNKWVAAYHSKVRETLAQGSIIFDYLWALYKPGDFIYELDEFEQPRLYVTAASVFRKGKNDLDAEMSDLFPLLPSINTAAGRFVVDTWYTDWDTRKSAIPHQAMTSISKACNVITTCQGFHICRELFSCRYCLMSNSFIATQKFTRKIKTMVIRSFSGTRNITSLEIYPFQYYKDGAADAATSLFSRLQARGHRWKGLITDPSSCLYHDGPAQELKRGFFRTTKQEKSHVSIMCNTKSEVNLV
jgi:hypothetical protein